VASGIESLTAASVKSILIRDEIPADLEHVRRIIDAAFESSSESVLVANLRIQAAPIISLVAEDAGQVVGTIVGHIMFSPVTIDNDDSMIFGLAPMAVAPNRQRTGVGSALIREGLTRCRNLGAAGVVVQRHPAYYPRFGFANASNFGISSEYDVPDEVFMAMELSPGGLQSLEGQVRYHPAFNAL